MKLRPALLVIMLAAEQTAAMGSVRAAESVDLGTETQLFVDDVLISRKSGVTRRVHPCRKLPQPVLEPQRAWERDVVNLVVAGRCFSADQLALSSARVSTTCAMMGQAAGIAAALSVAKGCDPRQLDPQGVRRTIQQRGGQLAL